MINKGEGLLKWACNIGYSESKKILASSSRKGSEVHDCIHRVLSDKDEVSPSDDANGYVESFYKFTERAEVLSEDELYTGAKEIKVYSKAQSYAGTADFVGSGVVLDWKTGRSLHPETALQTAAYAVAYNEMFPDSKIYRRYAVRLKEDGSYPQVKEYPPADLPNDFRAFCGAKDLFNWLVRG